MSKYNFNFAVSANIDAKTVQEMIKTVVEEQTDRKVKSVDLKVKMVSSGYQRNEYQTPVFEGVTVQFEQEYSQPKKFSSSLASQIDAVEKQGQWGDH